VRLRTDEHEQTRRRHRLSVPAAAIAEHQVGQSPFAAAHRLGAVADHDVRCGIDLADLLARLSAPDFPHIAATVDHLYGPDLTAQFDHGLRLLLAGLRIQLPATARSG
jgi:hypothetical protein